MHNLILVFMVFGIFLAAMIATYLAGSMLWAVYSWWCLGTPIHKTLKEIL